MGVRSGPKLPNTDNLLLCFDAMNAKSYAGEPSVSVGASYYRAVISTVPGET